MRATHWLRNSRVDSVYRSVLLSKFFVKGWGDPEHMKQIFNFRKILSRRDKCHSLVSNQHPIYIDKCVERTPDHDLYEGHFTSPLVDHLPVHPACQTARFQMLLPSENKRRRLGLDRTGLRPIVVHLAGTGDHFYWKRRVFMAKPLLEYGVGSIILENPFYGNRKPPEQQSSCLLNVSDLFIMGGCLIMECLALFHWLERFGYGPLAVTGISMGGHMASLAGCSWHKPISIVPCLSWTTASCVFTQGVLSGAIPWDLLTEQYKSIGPETIEEMRRMLNSPENDDMFQAGREFARQFPIDGQSRAPVSSTNEQLSDFYSKQLQNINYAGARLSSAHISVLDAKEERDSTMPDALNFMRGIMDECTHLGNFDRPVDGRLAIIVSALHDGYVPRNNIIPLNELWPGSELRRLDCGHVTAILFNTRFFQQAIIDALDLNARKYFHKSLRDTSTETKQIS